MKLWNRSDCCSDRLYNPRVELLDEGGNVVASLLYSRSVGSSVELYFGGVICSQVKVLLEGADRILALAEVEVFALIPTNTKNVAFGLGA